ARRPAATAAAAGGWQRATVASTRTRALSLPAPASRQQLSVVALGALFLLRRWLRRRLLRRRERGLDRAVHLFGRRRARLCAADLHGEVIDEEHRGDAADLREVQAALGRVLLRQDAELVLALLRFLVVRQHDRLVVDRSLAARLIEPARGERSSILFA